ncbi:hypothetical protein MKW98_029446 [Papaver atlanticum]|uniref:Splicing factor U2af large subunit n=1 Tax=Papaver atlanticum TaxID=357466 RepID=A0AAD4RX96_9MAGN|nr:hypothetical protein MKW98_029446 [Papaver atlanticum]
MSMADVGDFCSSSVQKKVTSHGSSRGADDKYNDHKFRDDSCERDSYSESRRRKRGRERYKDDKDMNTENNSKDQERRSQRDHRRVVRSDSRDHRHRNRDDHDGHRRRSYDDRDSDEERHRSRSRSKRIRVSGFHIVAPPSAAAPLPTISATLPSNMTHQATRHARRVYVGGLSPTANEQSVATFFSQVMSVIGGNAAGPGDAVVNVYINHEKKFAFVEMRSIEEASNAMALDGIVFDGAPVKVRRPTDYNRSLAAALGPCQPSQKLNLEAVGLSQGSTSGLEGSDRIFVGGLPYYFTEVQIRELLEAFGPLRGFDLVKDRVTGNSKGYAFCVYQDTSIMDIACASLNGIRLGDKTLTVRRASQGTTTPPKSEQENLLLQAQQQLALQRLVFQAGAVPSKVVRLTQVVSADELKDDKEYDDIVEDMRFEGGKYGSLASVIIPRPMADDEPSPGVGSVFLEFSDTNSAGKALVGLHGRKFGGNEVVAVYYPENKFLHGEYDA